MGRFLNRQFNSRRESLMRYKRATVLMLAALLFLIPILMGQSCAKKEKVGFIYVVHGGQDKSNPLPMWDNALEMFLYDPNHPVYTALWDSSLWGIINQSEFSTKFLRKYEFEYERIGGTDPFTSLTIDQMESIKAELDKNTNNIEFEADWACWMCGEYVENFPYPRYMFHDPSGVGDDVTYCGEEEADGPWEDCDPNRFDVDGPVERLLKKGVTKIIMADMTVGGVRFNKSYEVVELTKKRLEEWNEENGTSIPLVWVNDYKNLMERSFPTSPEGWTGTLGDPETDPSVPYAGNPNPIAEDPDLATIHVEAIEAGISDAVSVADTGFMIMNHALHDGDEVFDPKIDDTLIINKEIKAQLLEKYPDIDPDNIIGSYMGIKELNSENDRVERNRDMRGENIGHSYLYESDKEFPGAEWGYRYWDALEYLKDQGVKHIVISFTQIVTDSVLNLVEFPNQMAKEIGYKTWLYDAEGKDEVYPGVGNPFIDYWGNWVNTDCKADSYSDTAYECCFEMGGCDDGRPYPPERQTGIGSSMSDMDPHLAYDVNEYGHLGYDPEVGSPDPTQPVQDQYTGTWAMYRPPNDDPTLARIIAKYVLQVATGELK
jgi:hypothetical protein